jgi:hypothetical protein
MRWYMPIKDIAVIDRAIKTSSSVKPFLFNYINLHV